MSRQTARLHGAFTRLATGGDWAISQSAQTRRNLTWFWCDGFFASASDNIVTTYLVVYLLALGATQAQIGWMSSFSSLTAALLLMPGALLVERIGRRRSLVLMGGGWARLALILIALLPLAIHGTPLIFIAIFLSITRDAMNNLAFPAWMSMTADIVPMEGRGRFFASRNFAMSIAGIAITFLVGQLLIRTAQPQGYQISLGLAFAVGTLSIFSFGHISDHPRAVQPKADAAKGMALAALLRDITTHKDFLAFAIITALWNFSLNIAGPFFSVYLVQNLHADAAMVGYTTIASSVATMLAQRKLGDLNDRWGARKLTVISGLLIPIVPFLWVFANAGWQIIPINLLSGLLWGGYNLASFNYLLMITPQDRRPRYSAIFQIVVTVSLAVGAALGSLVVTHWGYHTIFVASAAGRLIAALLFARVAIVARRAMQPKPTAAA